jgi:hypothetical protein
MKLFETADNLVTAEGEGFAVSCPVCDGSHCVPERIFSRPSRTTIVWLCEAGHMFYWYLILHKGAVFIMLEPEPQIPEPMIDVK